MTSTQADVREFVELVRKAGYKVVKTGNGTHQKVLTKSGQVVTDDKGPLIISGSPSEHRWREMHVHRFIRAGVFKNDPYKKDQSTNGKAEKGKKHNRIADPDVQAAKILAIKARSALFKERTAVVRGRLEPVIVRLGGWGAGAKNSPGVSVSDFGFVVFHWAKLRGRVELPERTSHGPTAGEPITPAHVAANALRLKKPAETIGERWIPLFEIFMDELERNSGTPPDPVRSAARYSELLREAKGISPGPATPGAGPPAEPHEPGQVKPTAEVGPAYDVAAPKLALKTLYLLARDSRNTQEEAVALAEEIAELELNDRRRK